MPNLVETVAPAIGALLDPTLRTGLEAMLCAAAAWLGRESEAA
ncbi:hypothetical protein AB4Y36_38555 [Paraburkholderia sp. BR10936]|uniref:Uncharacterized protein n=1 Tax=Paraburkholderia guartelaensis TaxID=2546446 RepID=A0ABU9S9A9_9BURK